MWRLLSPFWGWTSSPRRVTFAQCLVHSTSYKGCDYCTDDRGYIKLELPCRSLWRGYPDSWRFLIPSGCHLATQGHKEECGKGKEITNCYPRRNWRRQDSGSQRNIFEALVLYMRQNFTICFRQMLSSLSKVTQMNGFDERGILKEPEACCVAKERLNNRDVIWLHGSLQTALEFYSKVKESEKVLDPTWI